MKKVFIFILFISFNATISCLQKELPPEPSSVNAFHVALFTLYSVYRFKKDFGCKIKPVNNTAIKAAPGNLLATKVIFDVTAVAIAWSIGSRIGCPSSALVSLIFLRECAFDFIYKFFKEKE